MKLIIQGGKPLKGAVRLGGAKNASFKLMIASLLNRQESRLLNISKISDVENTKKIIVALGGEIRSCGERTLLINSKSIKKFVISTNSFGEMSRSSTMFIGPLLARFGKAWVPFPGGDKIGPRPLERHFEGLESLGIKLKLSGKMVKASCRGLRGGHYAFRKNTHTGTETLIMAAVLAKGKTLIENAASEPEVDDLIAFLNKMGAKITRLPRRKIEIIGVARLGPVVYKVMPDRNEAVSYALAAVITKGDIVVENAQPQHLKSFLAKLDEAGGGYEIGNYGVRFFWKKPLKAVDITTRPHPGFMTDWQPLWSVLATQSQGKSQITEAVYMDRFNYVKNLIKMGANIKYFQPKVDNPDKFYNFNLLKGWENYYHGVEIFGPQPLKAVEAEIPDLRAGATLVLAGLVSKVGQTKLSAVEQIDRGYENLDGRLNQLGARIKRV